MEMAMMIPISFFLRYLMRIRRNAVKTRRMTMKRSGFAKDSGSSKAVIPAVCIGRERRSAIASTSTSIAGMVTRGMSRDQFMRKPRESQVT